MLRKALLILTGVGMIYSASGYARGEPQPLRFREFKSDFGQYYEFRATGYNIQPNRPGLYDRGCRTDNYYCTAALARCRSQEGMTFREPNIVREHR